MPIVGGELAQIRGLRDFQRELRGLDKSLRTELRQGLKRAAEVGAEGARNRASGDNAMRAVAAKTIRATAEQRVAKIAFGGASVPYALGAFMGALAYPQFDEWVGASWEPGVRGEGPYAINEGIADRDTQIVDAVAVELSKLARKAFPD